MMQSNPQRPHLPRRHKHRKIHKFAPKGQIPASLLKFEAPRTSLIATTGEAIEHMHDHTLAMCSATARINEQSSYTQDLSAAKLASHGNNQRAASTSTGNENGLLML